MGALAEATVSQGHRLFSRPFHGGLGGCSPPVHIHSPHWTANRHHKPALGGHQGFDVIHVKLGPLLNCYN